MYCYGAEQVYVSKVAGFFIRIMTNFDWFAAHFSCRFRVCSTLRRWPAVCAFKCQLKTLTHTRTITTHTHLPQPPRPSVWLRLPHELPLSAFRCLQSPPSACCWHSPFQLRFLAIFIYSRCSRIRMHHLAQQAQLPNYHHHRIESNIRYIKNKPIWNMNGTTRPPLDTNSTQLTNWPKIRAARPARGTDPLPYSQVVEVVSQYVGSPWSVSNRIIATATTTATTSCTHV